MFTQPTFIVWTSDVSVPGVTSAGNPDGILGLGIGPTGQPFDFFAADTPMRTVPDTSSTLILLGMSLAGTGMFR